MAGKGHKRHPINRDAFRRNFDRIEGSGRKLPDGRYVVINGELVPVERAPARFVKKHDNANIRSVSSGVCVEQVDEFNRQFGHLGVQYDPQTGDAVYKDRRSKLRVLKERGMFDRDEVCG